MAAAAVFQAERGFLTKEILIGQGSTWVWGYVYLH